MDAINLTMFPLEVMSEVFHHLPLQSILYTIPKVCQQWRDFLQQPSYWWERLNYEGIKVSRELRLDLSNNIDHTRIIQLLQATCQKHADTLYPGYIQEEFDNGGVWTVNEEQVSVAGIYLMFRTPKLVIIDISSKAADVQDLDILLLQLSYKDCQVHLIDQFSWKLIDMETTSDGILKYLIRDDVKCRLDSFCGSVKSINSLPKSILLLNLAIASNKSGCTIDPGIVSFEEKLPVLRELRIHIRSGTDVSGLSNLPTLSDSCRRGLHVRNGTSLYLSHVGPSETAWACEAARVLQPAEGIVLKEYQHLVFISSSLTMDATEKMLTGLSDAGVLRRQVVVASPDLDCCAVFPTRPV